MFYEKNFTCINIVKGIWSKMVLREISLKNYGTLNYLFVLFKSFISIDTHTCTFFCVLL